MEHIHSIIIFIINDSLTFNLNFINELKFYISVKNELRENIEIFFFNK